jgi:hypothetical protein
MRARQSATLPAELLRGLFGTWIAFFLLVYLPVGLVAFTAQDGWTAEMRSGMGVEAPLPLRLFAVLRAWTPWALVLLGIAVLAHVSLRRELRARDRHGRWSGRRLGRRGHERRGNGGQREDETSVTHIGALPAIRPRPTLAEGGAHASGEQGRRVHRFARPLSHTRLRR